jgi:hypothetical protein
MFGSSSVAAKKFRSFLGMLHPPLNCKFKRRIILRLFREVVKHERVLLQMAISSHRAADPDAGKKNGL